MDDDPSMAEANFLVYILVIAQDNRTRAVCLRTAKPYSRRTEMTCGRRHSCTVVIGETNVWVNFHGNMAFNCLQLLWCWINLPCCYAVRTLRKNVPTSRLSAGSFDLRRSRTKTFSSMLKTKRVSGYPVLFYYSRVSVAQYLFTTRSQIDLYANNEIG